MTARISHLLADGERRFRQRASRTRLPAELTTGPLTPAWPELPAAARHGLAGDILRAIEPHSEADPVALLSQLLVGVGNLIGRTAHYLVEGDRHFLNLFVVLVGPSGKGRKGTSWGRVRQYLSAVDPLWAEHRVQSGLASGEGLVWAIRDPVRVRQPIKERGTVVGYQNVEVDPGVADKRLLTLEEEFAAVLRMLERQGNSLSARLREAWAGKAIDSITKTTPTQCDQPHVSLIGHVTDQELKRYLTATESANGFGNRHLWLLVRRSKCLPEGGQHVPDPELVARLAAVVDFARAMGPMRRDGAATARWAALYPLLSEGRPGLYGCLVGRAEAQVMRLACLYALLDESCVVEPPHLEAALALWHYADASVRYLFGDATGDHVADQILTALRRVPEGLSRSQLSDLFGRNLNVSRIKAGLSLLLQLGAVTCTYEPTQGRAGEIWMATSEPALPTP